VSAIINTEFDFTTYWVTLYYLVCDLDSYELEQHLLIICSLVPIIEFCFNTQTYLLVKLNYVLHLNIYLRV
jgi:hypothetical protein